MGQGEILNFLRKNKGKWFLAYELMNYFKLARGSIVRTIKILVDRRDIEKRPAIDVIKDKTRIKTTATKANAYRYRKTS